MVHGLLCDEPAFVEFKRDAMRPRRKPDTRGALHAEQPVTVLVHHAVPQPASGVLGEFSFEPHACIDWLRPAFHGESIPYFYTEYIGRQLIAALEQAA